MFFRSVTLCLVMQHISVIYFCCKIFKFCLIVVKFDFDVQEIKRNEKKGLKRMGEIINKFKHVKNEFIEN